MDGDVQAHEFDKGLVIAKAKQGGKIVGVVFGWVNGRELAFTKNVAINPSRNIGEFGNPRILSASKEDNEEIDPAYRSMESSKTGPQ